MKVFVLLESGIFDYEQNCFINIISTNKEKVQAEYEKRKKEIIESFKEEFNDDYWNEGNDFDTEFKIEENESKTLFDIYKDGYAVENSKRLEIIEKEIV